MKITSLPVIVSLFISAFISTDAFCASSFIPIKLQHDFEINALTIKTYSDLNPLPNATLIIETKEGKLLEKLQTGKDGTSSVTLTQGLLESGVHITALAHGFTAVSVLSNTSNMVELHLQKLMPDEYPILSGLLKGFDEPDNSGEAQVGIVAKAVGLADLGQLDSTAFVSPINDQIPVYGRRDVPSNLVLPDQWFMVSVVPVHVNKPKYRLPVMPGSRNRYMALSGIANVKEVLSALQKNQGEKILDHLNVTRVAISDVVRAPDGEFGSVYTSDDGDDDKSKFTLNLDANMRLSKKVKLAGNGKAPVKGTRHIVGALWEPFDSVFVPTGVCFTDGSDVSLKTASDGNMRIIDLNLQDNGSRFRGEWLDQKSAKQVPDTSLQTRIFVDRFDSKWVLESTDTYDMMVVRMSKKFKTKMRSWRIEDRWVVVSPFSKQFEMPVNAVKILGDEAASIDINYLSADLLKTPEGGYPYIDGEKASKSLKVLEKVTKDQNKVDDGSKRGGDGSGSGFDSGSVADLHRMFHFSSAQ